MKDKDLPKPPHSTLDQNLIEDELAGQETVTIDISDISDNDFVILAQRAHEQGITFEQLCNEILMKYILEIETKRSAILEKGLKDIIQHHQTIAGKMEVVSVVSSIAKKALKDADNVK